MLTENIELLNRYAPQSLKDLLLYEKSNHSTFIDILDSKAGKKTIQVNLNGNIQLIHSKYDPQKEAESFIAQFKEIAMEYEHVLFYGIGFGYHIKAFMDSFPLFTFSIYEPEIEVFYQFMNQCRLSELPLERLTDVLIETSREKGKLFIHSKIHNIQERVLVVTLPSYERIFKERFEKFSEDFKDAMEAKRQSHYINMNFSARWILNSLLNLPVNLQTPSILDGFESFFKDKPLIIVSAGPSLEEEYNNLRFIKENKLAYIFAVGSANRALIANNIMPDAVCTYDPQGHNYGVYTTMFEKGIDTIPMIYGSSVGFETLQMYKGPKLHMITDQDTVSPYYLKKENKKPLDFIQDSPTIAAVTFQLAAKLGCNPIIFAGQNLGFRNNQYYSKDVNYDETRSINVMERDKIGLICVKDVYGKEIETNPSFNNMRENIEWYISQYTDREVINTTKGGAAIKGSTFLPLEELINVRLNQSVVNDKWFDKNKCAYDQETLSNSIEHMERTISKFKKIYSDIMDITDEIKNGINLKREQKVTKNIMKFDKLIKSLTETDFYSTFVQPINREYYQALSIKAANIRKQTNEFEKAKLILDAYLPYLDRCKAVYDQLVGSVYKIHELIHKHDLLYKFYSSDCGAFKYEGLWKRINQGPGENINLKIQQYISCNKDASIKFRFTGSSIRVYVFLNSIGSIKLQVKLDDQLEVIKLTKSSFIKGSNYNQIIVEKNHLPNKEHEVEIKLIEDGNEFYFYGVDIEENARILHDDEVMKIEELSYGKRIRAHYNANYKNVGVLSNLGKDTSSFIKTDSLLMPHGDFYFVMVDTNKCIADRNIQRDISWDCLYDREVASENGLSIDVGDEQLVVRLMTGGINPEDENNEWHKYIQNTNLTEIPSLFWHLERKQLVWCLENFNKEENMAVYRGDVLKDGNVNAWGKAPSLNIEPLCFRPLIILSDLKNSNM